MRGSQSIPSPMWTVGSTEISVEEATHHSGLDADF